jgi:tetratricopeptide (TPR) repeat protein
MGRLKSEGRQLADRAEAMEEAGRFEEAIELWKAAVAVAPRPFNRARLGRLCVREGDVVEGERILRETIADHPEHADAYCYLGMYLREQARYEDARPLLETSVQLDPSWAPAFVALGFTYRRLGMAEPFRECFERATTLDPDNENAWFGLGEAWRGSRAHEQAAQCYRKAIALDPEYGDAHRELAMVLWQLHELADAEAHARTAIRLDANDAWAHCYLNYILEQDGRHEEAEAPIRKAVELWPEMPLFHCNLGDLLIHFGRISEAEAAYRQALTLEEDNYVANLCMGKFSRDRGDFTAARTFLERALQTAPNELRIKEAIARVEASEAEALADAGQQEEAFVRWRAALAADPGPARQTHFAQFCIEYGREAEGETLLRTVIRDHPTYRVAPYYLGEYYADNVQDYPRAAEYFRQVIALDPHDSAAHRELGRVLWHNEDNESAEKHLREAIRLDRHDAWSHDYLGNILAAERDDEAETAFRTAIKLEPDVVKFHCHLGKLLMFRGRELEAKRSLETALSLDVSGHLPNLYMGRLHRYQGKLTQARRYFERALHAAPNSSLAREALDSVMPAPGEPTKLETS